LLVVETVKKGLIGLLTCRLIRDVLVEKIWEGTINVCALDLVRAVTKEPQAIEHYLSVCTSNPVFFACI
jgi:hypothetical protein